MALRRAFGAAAARLTAARAAATSFAGAADAKVRAPARGDAGAAGGASARRERSRWRRS